MLRRSPEGRGAEARWPSTPPLRREEAEEPPALDRAPVALELPDLEIEVKQAPRLVPPPPAPPNTDRQVTRRDARTEDVRLRAPTGGAAARREKASSASAFSALAKLAAPPKPQEPIPSPPAAEPAPPSNRTAASAPAPAPERAAPTASTAAVGSPPAAAPAKAPSMDLSWVTSKPSWAPTSAGLDEAEPEDEGEAPVALSKDETIVLLNYDATDSLEAISQRTGFSVFKVERIVDRLMSQGVFDDLPTAAAAAPDSKPRPPAAKDHAPSSGSILAAVQAEPPPESLEGPPTVAEPDGPEIETKEEEGDDEAVDDDDDDDAPDSAAETRRGEEADDEATEAELEANYRKLYETKLARLGADQRIAIATTGSGADLFALCFDKDPAVFRPLFENEHFFVDQARFAAFHHPTSAGIDRLAQRNELLKDPLVQRRLLRNGHTPELVVRRILASRRLLDVFKVTNDRDVPDRQRMVARGTLRQKFTTADPEERLQLLWNTEGRALTLLSGCAIDSKTTALFCARPVVSLLMVQNFAKFGATPPGMLNHFLKQNLVRRQIPLRNMLLKHPNCPSEAKRGF